MKKKAGKFVTPIIMIVAFSALLILYIVTGRHNDAVSLEAFSDTADLVINESKVGAKVTLKEAIHGTDDITYRYILKTDCPSWDYEDRYATKTPISWATDDTAAVEVLVYDAQVRYGGTAYASGTYYTVPLFGGLSSEDMPLDDWKQSLIKQAYTVYTAEIHRPEWVSRLMSAAVPVIAGVYIGIIRLRKRKLADKKQGT